MHRQLNACLGNNAWLDEADDAPDACAACAQVATVALMETTCSAHSII